MHEVFWRVSKFVFSPQSHICLSNYLSIYLSILFDVQKCAFFYKSQGSVCYRVFFTSSELMSKHSTLSEGNHWLTVKSCWYFGFWQIDWSFEVISKYAPKITFKKPKKNHFLCKTFLSTLTHRKHCVYVFSSLPAMTSVINEFQNCNNKKYGSSFLFALIRRSCKNL